MTHIGKGEANLDNYIHRLHNVHLSYNFTIQFESY